MDGVRASFLHLSSVKTAHLSRLPGLQYLCSVLTVGRQCALTTCLSCSSLRRLGVETSRRWWWRWLAEPSTPEPPPSSRSLTTGSQVVFCSAELVLPRSHSSSSSSGLFFPLWEEKKCVGRTRSSNRLVDPSLSEGWNKGDDLFLDDYRLKNDYRWWWWCGIVY